MASERFEESGLVFGARRLAAETRVPFRTDQPFPKITVNLTAPNGKAEKIEFLCDGQQVVVDGTHPTGRPYCWFGGEPWHIRRDELPYIDEHEARRLLDGAVTLLTTAFGYTPTAAAPKSNGIAPGGGGEAAWKYHLENIRAGRALHDSIRDLAAMLIGAGLHRGAAAHLLGALMECAHISHDERWDARYRD